MQSKLAIESVESRSKVIIPLASYAYPLGVNGDEKDLILDEWNAVSKRDNSLLTDDLSLRLVRFDSSTLEKTNDVGLIHTNIDATDSWLINCTLSHIPSHLRTIDKRLGVTSHFPSSGLVDFTPTLPIPPTQLPVIEDRINRAIRESTYLLLDCSLPHSSREGYTIPKGWLWDVYKEVGRQLDPDYNSDDVERYNDETCIRCANGRIVFGKNGRGVYKGMDGRIYNEEEMKLNSTRVTDEYASRTETLLQRMYERGIIRLVGEVEGIEFERINETLHQPVNITYPSAVELLYMD